MKILILPVLAAVVLATLLPTRKIEDVGVANPIKAVQVFPWTFKFVPDKFESGHRIVRSNGAVFVLTKEALVY